MRWFCCWWFVVYCCFFVNTYCLTILNPTPKQTNTISQNVRLAVNCDFRSLCTLLTSFFLCQDSNLIVTHCYPYRPYLIKTCLIVYIGLSASNRMLNNTLCNIYTSYKIIYHRPEVQNRQRILVLEVGDIVLQLYKEFLVLHLLHVQWVHLVH